MTKRGWAFSCLGAVAAGLVVVAAGVLTSCEREVLLGYLDELPDLARAVDAAPPDLARPRVGFRSPLPISVGSDPRFIKGADVDRDGHLDLVVAHGADRAVHVLLGRGDGSFARTVITPTSEPVTGLLGADFDLDQRIDLAVLQARMAAVQIVSGRGDGSFGTARSYSTASGALTAADFNRDGRPDLAVASASALTVFQSGALGIGFEALTPLSYPLPSPAAAVAAGDLDRDLYPDLVVVMATEAAAHVYRNSGGSGFREHVDALPESSQTIGLYALEPSGTLSAVISSPTAVSLLTTSGGALREDAKFPSRYAVGRNPYLLDGFDLDRDGRLDLLAASGSEPVLSVLFGSGFGDFQGAASPIALSSASLAFTVGDWNEDRIPDVAVVTSAPPGVELHLGVAP